MAQFASGMRVTAARENGIFPAILGLFATKGFVGTSGTLTSTATYTNTLTGGGTTGPSVTLTSAGSLALVWIAAETKVGTDGNGAFTGVAVSGATTLSAATNEGNGFYLVNRNIQSICASQVDIVAITPGTNTYEMQYRVGGATQVGTWVNRRIIVWAP